jgi:hypothetical protein
MMSTMTATRGIYDAADFECRAVRVAIDDAHEALANARHDEAYGGETYTWSDHVRTLDRALCRELAGW